MTLPTAGAAVRDAVTALFVPGDRPERFAKAAAAGADLVIVDLEDAVPPRGRAEALANACAALQPLAADQPALRALVRITDSASPTHPAEVEQLARLATRVGHGLVGVVVPKAADPGLLAGVGEAFGDSTIPVPVVALVESAAGVMAATDLAHAPGVARLAFGALDFGLDAGAEPGSDTVRHARAILVLASRAGGLPGPLDSPSIEIADPAVVLTASLRARADGFGGRLCIHPAQVDIVRRAFLPTTEERRWAEAVLASGAEGADQVEGQMIDRPVLERALRIRRLSGDGP